MEIKIVKTEMSDVSFIAELEKICFSSPWSETAISDTLKESNSCFLTAYADGKRAGYAGMVTVLDEGHICNIAVSPEFRRCGIGQALVDAVKAAGQRLALSVIMLEARESNIAARSLYEKNGFEQVGVGIGGYSHPRENAIVYNYYLVKEEK